MNVFEFELTPTQYRRIANTVEDIAAELEYDVEHRSYITDTEKSKSAKRAAVLRHFLDILEGEENE